MTNQKPVILSENEIKERLKDLPGWVYANNKITKKFHFLTYLDAIAFVNKMAPFYEEIDHHADTHIFFNNIVLELCRYDVGGKVTDQDFVIAKEIEKNYAQYGSEQDPK